MENSIDKKTTDLLNELGNHCGDNNIPYVAIAFGASNFQVGGTFESLSLIMRKALITSTELRDATVRALNELNHKKQTH